MRVVPYYRVSTQSQGRSSLSLGGQQQCVADFVQCRGAQVVAEVMEIESYKKSDRPELHRALDLCRRHSATLLIAKLDRLARKVTFIANLVESDVPFVACDRPNATPLELHIFATMAEQEARDISARTRTALAAAKARGTKLGNPNGFGGKVYNNSAAVVAKANRFAESVMPVIRPLREQGASLAQIAHALREMNMKSPRGGNWTPASVRNVLLRSGISQL